MPSATIVQSAPGIANTGAGFSFVFPGTPTPGNVLVFLAIGRFGYFGDSAPTFSTDYSYGGGSSPLSPRAWVRTVQLGDGTSWAFSAASYGAARFYWAYEVSNTFDADIVAIGGNASGNNIVTTVFLPDNNSEVLGIFGWGYTYPGSPLGVSSVSPSPYTTLDSVASITGISAVPVGGGTAIFPNSAVTVALNGTPTAGTALVLYMSPRQTSATSLMTSGTPSVVGNSVTFTISVSGGSGTPTGTVILTDSVGDFSPQTLTLSSGSAMYSTSALTVNNHTITAVYNGDSTYEPSNNSLMQMVDPLESTTTTVVSEQPTIIVGNPVTFTVGVTAMSGSPTGTITLTDSHGDFSPQVLTIGGSMMYTTSALTLGIHTITATYNGDTNYATSSGTAPEDVVSKITPVIVVVSSEDPSLFGDGVMFTIMVKSSSGSPTGTVLLHDDFGDFSDQILPLVPIDGIPTASYGPTTALSVGSHMVTATYSGDVDFASVETTLIQLVLTPRGDSLLDLPGFAVFASYSSEGDTSLPAWATFTAVPASTTAGTPVYILWSSNNVVAVSIEGAPSLINTNGSGIYEFTSGFSVSTVVTCIAFDSLGNIVTTENVLITIT